LTTFEESQTHHSPQTNKHGARVNDPVIAVGDMLQGPVISQTDGNDKKVIHRRGAGSALLHLLGEYPVSSALVEGYELVSQAKQHFSKKEYQEAIPLYEKGIQMALGPAKEQFKDSYESQDGMQWLTRAYAQEAEARLVVADLKGALASAQAACDLSNNSDSHSLEVLAKTCQSCEDARRELKALQSLFALPIDSNMSREVANRRRTFGFRLQTLERERAASSESGHELDGGPL
jgi:tetratricopeptide (TPR) repeat protein